MVDDGRQHVVVIGAGFCGLAAAHDLTKRGFAVTILEQDEEIGGLAGSFDVGGTKLEKFYHHWFTSDRHIMSLIDELGVSDDVITRPTSTGLYYANRIFRLSSPLDLLRFTPLSFVGRIRLGLMALLARRVKDWKSLETVTAADWLRQMGGDEVFRVVWEPLLRGKFGDYASEISAVWFWNKLKLRGSSRGKSGAEQLAYFRGGFARLADIMRAKIEEQGGSVVTGCEVTGLITKDEEIRAVETTEGAIRCHAVIATPALPIVARLLEASVSPEYANSLRRIQYLANVCLVLELDRSLSETYWLNVNDPSFPFVGVIEHTNFEPTSTYDGRHVAYLSKYLPESDSLYCMTDAEVIDFAVPHLQRMFPDFAREWILDAHVWRARFSQPVVEKKYSELIPTVKTPVRNFLIATMAQIYPEDRGTNYAIRQGLGTARTLARKLA